MSATRIALCLIAAAFIGAEIVRPTRIPAKKFAARALVARSQAVEGTGVQGLLDPNLLADLPRIHPDAAGYVRCSKRRDGSLRLSGMFGGGSDDGSAMFVIRDDVRLAEKATIFGKATQAHTFTIEIPSEDLGPGRHHLHVALISSDQRGFLLIPQAVTVGAGDRRTSPAVASCDAGSP